MPGIHQRTIPVRAHLSCEGLQHVVKQIAAEGHGVTPIHLSSKAGQPQFVGLAR